MSTGMYSASVALPESPASRLWRVPVDRSIFGDAVLVAFLFAQCLDGVFTYVGVATIGTAVEANPLIAFLMLHFGDGPALIAAKCVAALLGIGLHLGRAHGVIALLTVFYLLVAILPWVAILFA